MKFHLLVVTGRRGQVITDMFSAHTERIQGTVYLISTVLSSFLRIRPRAAKGADVYLTSQAFSRHPGFPFALRSAALVRP